MPAIPLLRTLGGTGYIGSPDQNGYTEKFMSP
jgi:hypothetical protein